jgi:hypothetical protein
MIYACFFNPINGSMETEILLKEQMSTQTTGEEIFKLLGTAPLNYLDKKIQSRDFYRINFFKGFQQTCIVKLKFHWKQHFSMLARIPCLT